jgi:hypothetical protein
MTPKGLIAIGLAWLVAVVLWVCFFDRSFSYVWMAPNVSKQAALIFGIYLSMVVYLVFLIGWLAPLGLGIYGLVRHR